MMKSGFFGGLVVGAAIAWAGAKLLNSEQGKEACKKAKDGLDKLVDDFKKDFNLDGFLNSTENTKQEG
ncbi:MAG: hypothetical protein MJZ28_08440 [Paludibacteraceae bacterium]|nr:hypothetical protein [Paludibacteraceae bacterium]